MDDKLKKVVATVLKVDPSDIHDSTSPDSVGSWDSLKHMQLVVALEQEFKIQFDDQDMLEMHNYGLIRSIVKSKLN
jgi:acyl carrier protein